MKRNTKLVSIALAVLMLCAVVVVPSMAQTSVFGPSASATINKIGFTKNVIVPNAATIPTASFVFKVIPGQAVTGTTADAISVNSNQTAGPVLPGIGTVTPITLNFTGSDTTIEGSASNPAGDTEHKYASQTAQFDFSSIEYKVPGIYRYTVFEETPTSPVSGVTYDKNSYTIDVVVGYTNTAAENSGTMSVLNVFFYQNDVDVSDNDGTQVNYENDKPSNTATKISDMSGVTFPNSLSTNDLTISKKVTGTLGDQEKYFDFAINLTGTSGYKYNFNLYDNGNLLVPGTPADDVTIAAIVAGTALAPFNDGTPEGIESGIATVIHMKHNQKIEILGLPVDTNYTVQEETVSREGYIASVDTTENGILQSISFDADNGTAGAKVTNTIVAGGNIEAFTNTKNESALTGVVLQVLPFMLIVLIAGAGLAALAISKRRKSHTNR